LFCLLRRAIPSANSNCFLQGVPITAKLRGERRPLAVVRAVSHVGRPYGSALHALENRNRDLGLVAPAATNRIFPWSRGGILRKHRIVGTPSSFAESGSSPGRLEQSVEAWRRGGRTRPPRRGPRRQLAEPGCSSNGKFPKFRDAPLKATL
jgi:hypothetical protein